MKRRQFLEIGGGFALTYLAGARAWAARAAGAESAPRVVIAGGGIMGASIAYHLAKRGAQVTLCEKLRPASGATDKSFAWLNSTFSKEPRGYFELNLLGMAGWRRLERELDGELKVQWGGCLEWYPEGREAEQFRKDVRRHQSWGYPAHFVDEAELRRLLPGIVPGPFAVGAFSEQDGTLDPVQAVDVLLRRAQKLGVHVLYPCEVTGLDLAGGRVRGVKSSRGAMEADVLVVACGVDTPRVAAMADLHVPMKDSPGVLAHSKPQPRVLERVAIATGATLKQNFDGRVVTGSDFGGSPISSANSESGRRMLEAAARYLPAMKGAELEKVTLGWRVMPKDEYPIVGFTDRCPNLYIAAMHSGVTLAPLMGQLAALEILDGSRVDLLAPYRLARFA